MKDQCEDHLLNSEIWSVSNPHPDHTPILLVLMDQVTYPLFMAHMWDLNITDKVTRVILDESQALVASQLYCPTITQLTLLVDMGIPLGLLLATLPSSIVPPPDADVGDQAFACCQGMNGQAQPHVPPMIV